MKEKELEKIFEILNKNNLNGLLFCLDKKGFQVIRNFNNMNVQEIAHMILTLDSELMILKGIYWGMRGEIANLKELDKLNKKRSKGKIKSATYIG